MSSNLQAEVLRVRDIFSSAADLKVPPYQRGFAWEDAETSALLNDLTYAFDNGSIYFLGAMVFIQTRGKGPSDVVDGQQRLTTLTIMLAVLRDMTKSADEAAALHAMIGHETLMFGSHGQRWRVSLNHLDMKFFRENIQARGAALKYDRMIKASASESQRRLAEAARTIHDFFGEWSEEERMRFRQWLSDDVSVVKVRVGEHNIGHRVFLVLNQRGKPLSDHDILKSALLERASFTDKETIQQSSRWNEFASRLGSAAFEGMLKQVRFIYDKKMRGEFIDGLLQSVLHGMTAATFITDVLPRFVDAYDVVLNGNYDRINPGPDAIRSLCFLRAIHHESWRAPAIKFLVDHPYDTDAAGRFFAGLERLAHMMQYAVKERDYRHKRYRRLLEAMDSEGGVFDQHSPLHLTPEDKIKLLDRLRGKFPNFKQRRALVLRLNAATPGGEALSADSDATLEHILPRTPAPDSSWMVDWSDPDDIEDLTECLGNFTLLTDADNQKADRGDFTFKMTVYFKEDNGFEPTHAITRDLRGLSRWTPEDVRRRRDLMVSHLAREWDLSPA